MTISEHTRRRFERAVVDLVRTPPVDRITVRAICARRERTAPASTKS